MARKVTIREVAKRAGVSPSTVSRVLNGTDTNHMRPETKARILKAIEELEYIPVKAARSLRKQRTQLIAVLVPDISNPFFSLLARGVESVAFSEGFSTLICDSNHSVEKESRYLDILLAERVEGIVFTPVGKPDMERIKRLLRCGVRIVVADRRVQGLPTVEADNFGGSRALTEYVIRLGYRRIAYLAGPKEVSTAQDRLAGFQEEMKTAGLVPVVVLHGDFTYESGYEYGRYILQHHQVDAIICANDLMAVGVIRAAEGCGFRVPDDVGVTGFDRIPWSEIFCPKLVTVEVPMCKIGAEAMRLITRTGTNSINLRNVRLNVRLIEGDSLVSKFGGRREGKY